MTTRLIFSIDTEVSVRGNECDAPDVQIYGQCRDGEFGINFIANELSRFGWQATYFLHVYDVHLWGEETYQKICDDIQTHGGDVQLHTHVENLSQITGRQLDHISQYSLKEQRDLLRQGIENIKRWTGRKPLWHRAGNLGANRDTLRACAAEGLIGDSSYAYGWNNCSELERGFLNRNRLERQNGAWELPVTTAQCVTGLKMVRHFDINACSLEELKSVTKQAVDEGEPYLVMLMHSFSFITRAADPADVRARNEEIEKLKAFLTWAATIDGLEVTTFSELTDDVLKQSEIESRNTQPAKLITGVVPTGRRVWRYRHRSRKSQLVCYAPFVLLAAVALAFLIPQFAFPPC